MKKWTINTRTSRSCCAAAVLVLAAAMRLQAQDSFTEDTDRRWYAPDHLVLQFAGNTGLLAAGIGYSYFGDHLQTDFTYGITPAFEGRTTIHTFNLKNGYRPFHIKLDAEEKYVLIPLRIGFGLTYSFGPQFNTFWPEKYPDGYYPFPTSIRVLPYVGLAVSRSLNDGRTAFKRLEAFGDLGTTDFDIAAKAANPNLPLGKVLNVALGVKAVF